MCLPSPLLFVGDDLRDIESGRDAGTRTAAVTYGYIHPDDNPRNLGADVVVDHPLELRKGLKAEEVALAMFLEQLTADLPKKATAR